MQDYYQHQMSQCDGDQRCTFVVLNNLMGRTLDPAIPTSSSDDELASRFSGFFFFFFFFLRRKSLKLGAKLMCLLLIKEFSINFPLCSTRPFTFSHLRSVTEADVLRYIREMRKTCCSLDPINVSKLGEAYESTAPAVGAIINSSFGKGHFVATERRGLIRP